MRKLIILTLLFYSCEEIKKPDPKTEIVEVDSVACIKECTLSSWDGNVNPEKVKPCTELYRKHRCCAIKYLEPSQSRYAGETGKTTACQVGSK